MIRQFLDLSSAHTSTETQEWLADQAAFNHLAHGASWHVAEHTDGWWCRVPVDSAPDDFPHDLLLVCDHARTLGAEYLLFDHDAEPLDALLLYDH